MNLLNLSALGFLALAIPLIAVYFLKVKPTKKITSTYFLWNQIFQEKKSSSLFKQLKDYLSLLMLLLALILVVLAMSEPVISKDQDRDYMIIIDNSASMNTKEGTQSRFDKAKSEATSILNAMGMNREVVLASVSNQLVTHVHRSSNLKQLLDGLEAMNVSVKPFSENAFSSLLDQPEILEQFRVIFVSDRKINQLNLHDKIEVLNIAEKANNVGLISFDFQYLPTQNKTAGMMFQLISTYEEDVEVDLSLSYENLETIRKVIPLVVKPGKNDIQVHQIQNAESGKWILNLEIEDDLDLDNQALAVLPEPIPIRVMIDGQYSYFYQRCVESFKDYQNHFLLVNENPDVLISHGSENKEIDCDQHIIFQPQGASNYWKEVGEERVSEIVKTIAEEHPYLKYIDFEQVQFKGQKDIGLTPGSVSILEDEHKTPLMFQSVHGDTKACVINMDPNETEFFLSVWFPILIFSLSNEMMELDDQMDYAFSPGTRYPEVMLKKDEVIYSQPNVENPAILKNLEGDFSDLGFYQFNHAENKMLVACSIIGESESFVNAGLAESTLKAIEKGYPPATYLIGLTFLLFFLESMLYHKRKVG